MSEQYLLIEETELNNQLDQRISYLATVNLDREWREKYRLKCILQHVSFIEQGDLSDFDYYKKISSQYNNKIKFNKNRTYYLLVDNNPVVKLSSYANDDENFEISFVTATDYRRKGYATKGVELLTNELFENEKVYSAIILPFVDPSKKIAEKNGYTLNEKEHYVKINNNYKVLNSETSNKR